MIVGREIKTGAGQMRKTIGAAKLKVFQIERLVPDHLAWVVEKP
tara:strand:+ start:511 stop:642 length:132 start_codon:yes stop_codon:yes gene_type:complete